MKNILIPPASGGDYVDNAEADFIEIAINKIQTIIPRSLQAHFIFFNDSKEKLAGVQDTLNCLFENYVVVQILGFSEGQNVIATQKLIRVHEKISSSNAIDYS